MNFHLSHITISYISDFNTTTVTSITFTTRTPNNSMRNFDITGVPISHFPLFIRALAMVKKAAALANHELGYLTTIKKDAIVQACDEIIVDEALLDEFPVDLIQGGAGTSTNMNANEVIANRGLELMGKEKGQYEFLHPNNDVNQSQSTNDVYPTAATISNVFFG